MITRSRIRKLVRKIVNLGKRYPVYFFHHIPKTGGTSVVKTIEKWFDLRTDYFNPSHPEEVEPVNLKLVNSTHCIAGHFGHHEYRLNHRYPRVFNSTFSKQQYRVFTFVREPLDMRCSLYRHQLKMNKEVTSKMTLAEHLMSIDNYTGRILSATLEDYTEILDRYFFVGLYDDLQLSFDILARLTKKPRIVLPVTNTTRKDSDKVEESLTDEEIELFKQQNQLDYLIYEYAQARQKKLMKRLKIKPS